VSQSTFVAPDHFRQQGWRGHLRRVERWHQRATRALDPHNRTAEEHAIDFLYAFFQAAYHMRDWLQNDGAAPKAKLEALMCSNGCLKLCRDLCNGSKHLVLDPKRSKTDHIGLMREYVPPPSNSRAQGRSRPSLLAFVSQEGEIEFRRIDELMSECLDAWQTFCSELS
jgi:hypothetical protein